MSQLSVILQGSLNGEREARTILALLREKMDGADGTRRRRRSLKERLGLKTMSCCGASWVFRPNTISVSDGEDEAEEHNHHQQQPEQHETYPGQDRPDNMLGPDCVGRVPVTSGGGMNLAAALAAERHLRAADGTNGVVGPTSGSGSNSYNNNSDNVGPAGTAPGTPLRVSLMRLLAQTDGCEAEEKAGAEVGNDMMCCVCMGRKKGAAFIPCGHTFCRVCSRELWLNRGLCPLCNRSILEILDIF